MILEERRTKIVGVTHKNKDNSNRQEIIKKCRVNEFLKLIHDPMPDYPNAIKICNYNNEQLGYLSDELATEIMDNWDLENVAAQIICITGGTSENPTLGVNIVLKFFDQTPQISTIMPDMQNNYRQSFSNIPKKICNKCKFKIDKKIKICPNCGKKQRSSVLSIIIQTIILNFIVICLLGLIGFALKSKVDKNPNHQTSNQISTSTPIPTPDYSDKLKVSMEVQGIYNNKQKIVVWLKNESPKTFSGSLSVQFFDENNYSVDWDILDVKDLPPSQQTYSIFMVEPKLDYSLKYRFDRKEFK